MFRYRREMYALQLKYVYTALLIIASIGFSEAIANGRSRRRFGPSTTSTKNSASEVTEKSKTDPMVAASSNTESNQYRRGGAYSTDSGEYSYNNADINLIRPESKPLHTKITAKYTSSISIPTDSLEDTETAEEYVAKAMGMYGSRLREPIRIPNESEASQAEQPQPQHQQLHHPHLHTSAQQQQQQQQLELQQQHEQQQLHEQQQQHEHQQHHHQQQQQQQHQQEQEQQLQQLHDTHVKPEHFDYYSFTQKDGQRPAPSAEDEQHQSQQYQYAAQIQAENEAAKAMLEAQMQAQLQEQMQQAQYIAKGQEEAAAGAAQQAAHQAAHQAEQSPHQEDPNQPPAPVYEKDPVTRSYNIYEEHTEGYEGSPAHLERNYRTKYLYKAVPSAYHNGGGENEDKIRVSASTEIPKAEIMKQIEKSVIRYMKELEAEGKIISAPQNNQQEPKTYFKVVTMPGSDEKRIASTTLRPKYSSSTNNYIENFKNSHGHSPAAASSSSHSGSSKYHKNSGSKTGYVVENESTFQNSGHDVSDVLAPNVEFIYKIKTKAPLHTATVKTVSKPYSMPLKGNYEQFDHSTALKNLEEFDLSHVVTTPDPEEHQSITSASNSKPSKLYFNSEIYHDINSMPFKQKQRAENEFRSEYRKKAAQEPHPDYKGYGGGGGNSGYYAEPPSGEAERDLTNSGVSEDGYPLMNPYQYVLKKESGPSKYEEAPASYEQPRSHKYKSMEFDSYNPKFNNNPEGYGYQQTYKSHSNSRHAPGKRGKRGGAPHPSQVKKSPHRSSSMKEYEANVALRPPPKV